MTIQLLTTKNGPNAMGVHTFSTNDARYTSKDVIIKPVSDDVTASNIAIS